MIENSITHDDHENSTVYKIYEQGFRKAVYHLYQSINEDCKKNFSDTLIKLLQLDMGNEADRNRLNLYLNKNPELGESLQLLSHCGSPDLCHDGAGGCVQCIPPGTGGGD